MSTLNGVVIMKLFLTLVTLIFLAIPGMAKADADWSLYPHQLTVIAFYSSTAVTPATLRTDTWQRQFYTLQKCQEAEAITRATKVPRVSGDSATVVSYITYCDPVVQH